MNKKKIVKILFVLAVVIIAGFFCFKIEIFNNKSSINAGFNLTDLNKFIIKEKFIPDYSTNKEEDISAVRGEEEIEIKTIFNFSKTQAEQYMEEQAVFFESLFDQKLPPYPEFVGSQTGCVQVFLPVLKNGDNGDYYLTYADQRQTYGICSEDLIKYKSGFGVFYCEASQKLYSLKYFIPSESSNFDSIDSLFKSFKCL